MEDARPGAARSTAALVLLAGLACALLVTLAAVARYALRPPTADPVAARAEPASPRSVPEILAAGRARNQQGDHAGALALLTAAAEGSPRDQELRLATAETLLFLKRHADAYRQLQLALDIGPDRPRLQFEAGTVANSAGLPERAAEHYQKAQAADPADPRYPLYLGMVQLKLGQDQAAIASFLRTLRLAPDVPEAAGGLAEAFLRTNDLALAARHAARARELQPAVIRWRLVHARVLIRQGDPEAALALLGAVDPAQRFQPDVLTLRAEALGLLRRPADAAAMYAEAAAAAEAAPDPVAAGARHALAARWFLRAGDAPRAREHARIAAERGNDDARRLLDELARAS